jgi:amidohydrolase
MEEDIHKELHLEIRRSFELARTLGGEYELKFEIGDPPMINAPRAVDLIKSVATELIGEDNVTPMDDSLGAEDFGRFSSMVPGAMFTLGAQIAGDERIGHNPLFDIDENALPIGTAILVDTALRYLGEK